MNYEKASKILESYGELEDYIIEKSESLLKWYGENITRYDYSHYEYESIICEEGVDRLVSLCENCMEDYINIPLSLFFMNSAELEKYRIKYIRDREEKEKIRKEEIEKAKHKKQKQAEESEYELYLKLQEKYERRSMKKVRSECNMPLHFVCSPYGCYTINEKEKKN